MGAGLTSRTPTAAWPCFVTPATRWGEAVVARQRALLHSAGDHFTLINVFNAFLQRECRGEERRGGARGGGGPLLSPRFPVSPRERP